MLINNVIISQQKFVTLSKIMPESLLRHEYEIEAFSDIEIAKKYLMSSSWVCKLRKVYGIHIPILLIIKKKCCTVV